MENLVKAVRDISSVNANKLLNANVNASPELALAA